MLYNQKYNLLAYAKLNLRLKIVGRREDGYHLLSMVNSLIDLADEMEIEVSQQGDCYVSCDKLVSEENIIYKAIKMFLEQAHLKVGVKVNLKKNIPMGAGLGGGSSDAATILQFLAEFFPQEAERIDLSQLALQLGADVPYFMTPDLALVEGIGEKITPLISQVEPLDLALLIPEQHISTPQAFSLFRQTHQSLVNDNDMDFVRLKKIFEKKCDYQGLLDISCNDLTEAAKLLSSQVGQAFEVLSQLNFGKICLTGSGSAMFIIPKDDGKNLIAKLKKSLLEKNLSFLKIIPIKLLDKNQK